MIKLSLAAKVAAAIDNPDLRFSQKEARLFANNLNALILCGCPELFFQLLDSHEQEEKTLESALFVALDCLQYDIAQSLITNGGIEWDEHRFLTSFTSSCKYQGRKTEDMLLFLLDNIPATLDRDRALKVGLARTYEEQNHALFNFFLEQKVAILEDDLLIASQYGEKRNILEDIMTMINELEENPRGTDYIWKNTYLTLADIHQHNPELTPYEHSWRMYGDTLDEENTTDEPQGPSQTGILYSILITQDKLTHPDAHIYTPRPYERAIYDNAEEWSDRLIEVFGTADDAIKYVEKFFDHTDPNAVHDAALFNTPELGEWHPEIWKAIAMEKGRRGLDLISLAPSIEGILIKEGVWPEHPDDIPDDILIHMQKSLLEIDYKRAYENSDFALYCKEQGISERIFNKGLDILHKVQKSNIKKKAPTITIDGADISHELAHYEMLTLAPDDFRGLLLGKILYCCQHIAGAGAECAEHGVASPYGNHYVIQRKAKGNKPAEIVAASWGWMGRENSFTFDSFERISSRYNELFLPFMSAAADAISQKHNFTQVTVGRGGGTPGSQHHDLPEAEVANTPIDYKGYSDAKVQLILASNHISKAAYENTAQHGENSQREH